MIKMFLIEYKFILTEWKYILISWKKGDIIKIYFIEYKFVLIEWKYILISWKKSDIMKIYFIKYKVILIEWKYIFISYEFLLLQHFSNHTFDSLNCLWCLNQIALDFWQSLLENFCSSRYDSLVNYLVIVNP